MGSANVHSGFGGFCLRLVQRHGALVALAGLCAYSAQQNVNFLTPENLLNIVRQMSFVGIVAVGMTFVITLGGIDLSVGSMVAFIGGAAILVLNRLTPSVPEWTAAAAACAVCVLTGPLLGLANGLLVAYGRIAPFIATLGAMAAYRALALAQVDGGEFRSSSMNAFPQVGQGMLRVPFIKLDAARVLQDPYPVAERVLQVPYPVVVLAAVAVAAWLVLRRTPYGRQVVAIGSNEQAAIFSGVKVARIKAATYTLMGGLCGLSAMLISSRMNSVSSSQTGLMYELDAIAAVVIGGTRMEGGYGTIYGTIVGVLMLGVINNMLNFSEVSPYLHGLVKGAIIIAAVLVQGRGSRQ